MKSVNAVKKKDGTYTLRITMNDGMPISIIPLQTKVKASSQVTHFRRLHRNKSYNGTEFSDKLGDFYHCQC